MQENVFNLKGAELNEREIGQLMILGGCVLYLHS